MDGVNAKTTYKNDNDDDDDDKGNVPYALHVRDSTAVRNLGIRLMPDNMPDNEYTKLSDALKKNRCISQLYLFSLLL